jgi:hypothetical protein
MFFKRSFSGLCAALSLVLALAGCGGEATITTTSGETPSAATTAEKLSVPAGYIAFATADAFHRVAVTRLAFLKNSLGETVRVDENSALIAKFDTQDRSVLVTNEKADVFNVVVQDGDPKILYAEIGDNPAKTTTATTKAQTAKTTTTANKGTSSNGATTTKTRVATTKKTTTTKKVTTTKKTTTTKKSSNASSVIASQQQNILDSSMTSEQRRSAFELLNYKIDANGVFYVASEPWQKKFGFNKIYDIAAPFLQMVYSTVRIYFTYDYVYDAYTQDTGSYKVGDLKLDAKGNPVYKLDAAGKKIPKDWMVQMWKGRYGLVMIGGEIGVYTKAHTQTTEHYFSASKQEELTMAMDAYHMNFLTGASEKIFTRGPMSAWWLTGFVPGNFYQQNKKAEIIMVANLKFPNETMLGLFVGGLKNAGFSAGSPGPKNPESYVISGLNVKFCWQYIDVDAG